MELSDAVLDATKKDGRSIFENQVAWAQLYLAKSGYIDRSRRGVWALTEKGRRAQPLSSDAVENLLSDIQRKPKSFVAVEEDVSEEPGPRDAVGYK